MNWFNLARLNVQDVVVQAVQVLASVIPELVALGVVIAFLVILNATLAIGVRKLKRDEEEDIW